MARTEDGYVIEILRLESLLRAYLHRFAPRPVDLEDLLQETYTRLLAVPLEHRSEIQAVQAFALTTARNIAVDWSRRRQIVPIDLVEDLDALAVSEDTARLDEIVDAHQELVQIAEAVADLPNRCAEVFTLRKVYGWSQREIAEHFGISISTVENHLVKAVRRCKERIGAPVPTPAPATGWIRRRRRHRGNM